MATKTGVWDLQQVRDKQLASEWGYQGDDPGHLFVWGRNQEGQLGLNDGNDRSSPTQLPGVWKFLYSSKRGSSGIKSDGTLWAWGENGQGQLGQNEQNPGGYSSPVQVPGTTWATVVRSHDGHTAATKTDGTIWAWGANSYNIWGNNPAQKFSSPTQIWSGTDWGQTPGSLATGPGNIGAVKTDGTLWLWGRNWDGSSGQNDTTSPLSSPKQVGTNTTWSGLGGQQGVIGTAGGMSIKALKTDGTMWVWGRNWNGTLGLNQSYSDLNGRSSPMQLGTDTNWTNRLSGGGSSCFHIKTDGTLWSWGYDQAGTLGQNQSPGVKSSSPVQVGTDTTWYNVACTENTIAIKTDGTLWAMGGNPSGALGQNSQAAFSSPVQIPGTWIVKGALGSFDTAMCAMKYTS
tara:strand:- start:307 stop:1509 length:1203 start_codon:yes stop_codon:yes gene_type:complete